MKFHIINDLYFKDFHAGYKARYDVIETVKSDLENAQLYNFYKIELKDSKYRIKRILSRRFANYYNFLAFSKFCSRLDKDDVVLIQFPFEGLFHVSKAVYNTLYNTKKKNGIKIILLIHDLDSIRRIGQIDPQNEIRYLNFADVIISHNPKMTNWIVENGVPQSKIVDLNLFDYRLPIEEGEGNEKLNLISNNVVYAGNLGPEKAGFIYKWKPSFTLRLYGTYLQEGQLSGNIAYNGVFDPNSPTIDVSGKTFGLVWDGDSTNSCTGLTGQYLKFNNPHKASLYLSQGLPLLVWNESALADLVRENNIGRAINSLEEIEKVFQEVSDQEYEKIKQNVNGIKIKLRSGAFLKEAIKNSFEIMSKSE